MRGLVSMPDTTQLGVRIDTKIASLLSKQTKKRGKSKKELIERALLSYLAPASYEKLYGSINGSSSATIESSLTNKDLVTQVEENTANIAILLEQIATLREKKATIESIDGSKDGSTNGSNVLPSETKQKPKVRKAKKKTSGLKVAGQIQGNRGGKPADLFEYRGKVATLNIHLTDALPKIDKNSLKNAKINIKRRAKKGTHTIEESISHEIESLQKKLKKSS